MPTCSFKCLHTTPAGAWSPRLLNASRKRRIAKGSGTSVQDVNQLINQFREMQKMMAQLKSPRGLNNLMNMFR